MLRHQNNGHDIVKNVFTTLAQIASVMDKRPDRNGCVVTKINLTKQNLVTFTYGKLIFDEEGYQFARFLCNSTEKATRAYRKEVPHVSGAVNLQLINMECSMSENTYNVYACSGFEEKYNEGIVFIGGLFEDIYVNKPGRDLEYYLTEVGRLIPYIIGNVEKLSFSSPSTIKEMFRLLEKKLKKQKVLI